MKTVTEFEDFLELLHDHKVRYVIIGGLAFIFHVKPRYTKDMDLWIDPSVRNVRRANEALAEFGSPLLLDEKRPEEILQIGVAPHRIDMMLQASGVRFETAWDKRISGRYGNARANWVDLNTLIRIKSRIKHPRHREDVRELREVLKLRRGKSMKSS